MSFNKGKYDEACTVLRKTTGASCAVAIIIDGEHGNGFSVQTNNPHMIDAIPSVLRILANSIERDIRDVDGGVVYEPVHD